MCNITSPFDKIIAETDEMIVTLKEIDKTTPYKVFIDKAEKLKVDLIKLRDEDVLAQINQELAHG